MLMHPRLMFLRRGAKQLKVKVLKIYRLKAAVKSFVQVNGPFKLHWNSNTSGLKKASQKTLISDVYCVTYTFFITLYPRSILKSAA